LAVLDILGWRELAMNKTVIFASIGRDGTLNTSDRSEESPPSEPIAAIIPEHVEEAVCRGPNDTTADAEDFQSIRSAPHVATLRRALALTQKEFAARYHIPLAALRDWEREHSEPDQPMCAYLTVIARYPTIVLRALQKSG
jgi:putative transcriptional regulator